MNRHVLTVFLGLFLFQSTLIATNKAGEKNSNHKITEQTARDIWKALQGKEKTPKIARRFKVSLDIVRSIKYGKRWTCVTGLKDHRTKQNSLLEKKRTAVRLANRQAAIRTTDLPDDLDENAASASPLPLPPITAPKFSSLKDRQPLGDLAQLFTEQEIEVFEILRGLKARSLQ